MRVLIVDDNEVNIELLEQLLAQAGYTNVLSTNQPETVPHLCRSWKPDLILLDLHMPQHSGFDVMQSISEAMHEPDNLPVLVVTADNSRAARHKALAHGARDFVTKPIDNDELMLRVRTHLLTRALQQQLEHRNDLLELDLRLAQKLEAVGQLAAGIAHEINTPVQYIGNSVSFLQEAADKLLGLTNVYHELLHTDEPIGKAERRRRAVAAEEDSDLEYLTERIPLAIGRALDGIQRVSSIVRAMRQFAHPSTERSTIDVNEGLQNTLIVATNEYKYVADIELDLGELPLVLANGSELNQVFLNLIVNASHAIEARVRDTDQRGTITVRTRANDAGVTITVSDTGCGIPAEIAGRVFDPFFTTKPVGRGTGQGLAIAHTIVVESHNGALNFEPNPGGGTIFRVSLPTNTTQTAARPWRPAA